ncbi:MAG TPA: Rieske (2Fe-2S) protein, partial [Thermomonas sp.]|nr:Rieske (2Fe-2S) protein [Thermomonas sp.]
LVCAAHGASFELANGVCVAGPCRGESLRAVAVEVRDGGISLAQG